MSTKFTPGPWAVDVHRNVMAQGGLVAFPGIAAGFDQEANARLIAAAPELLRALKDARNYVEATVLNASSPKTRENYSGCLRRIDEAIEKAIGEQP